MAPPLGGRAGLGGVAGRRAGESGLLRLAGIGVAGLGVPVLFGEEALQSLTCAAGAAQAGWSAAVTHSACALP